MKALALLPLSSLMVFAQDRSTGPAKAIGHCNIVTTGNHNTYNFYNFRCDGITRAQGDGLLRILNEILAKQIAERDALASIQQTLEANANSGFLTPGSDPPPPNECSWLASRNTGSGKPILYFGNSGSVVNQFPHTVIEAGKKTFLSLDMKPEGLSISLEAYDQDRKIMVQIADNEFIVNPNRIFRKIVSEDKHGLRVIGESNEEVLNIRFLNPTAISILTDFYLPNGVRIHITPTEWHLGTGPSHSSICFSGKGADIGMP